MTATPEPKPSPKAPDNGADYPHTPAYGIASADYVKRKLAEAQAAGARAAKVQGIIWGISLIVVAVGIAFGVYFKLDDKAQEKADKAQAQAISEADAGADKKLAPIATDVAVMKNDIGTLKDDVAEIKNAQRRASERDEEMLRLLRRRDNR